MTQELNVGLVGYGFAGRAFHAPVVTAVPGMKLRKVVERSADTSKKRYPWIEVVKSTEELFADESIDLVIIATPSTNHYEVSKAALLANKHVVIEKPFTTTTAEADELIQLAKQRNRLLSVYHNRRWDGDFLTIQQLLNNKMLGEVVEYEAHWDWFVPHVNLQGWREQDLVGSGVLYDLCVHFADQALCLFGLPQTITADVRVQREGAQSVDYFDVKLGYANDLKVIMKSSKLVRETEPRYVIHGTKGSYVKYGIDPQEAALIEGKTPLSAHWAIEPEANWGKINTEINGLHIVGKLETIVGGYERYYQNIYDAIVHKQELVVKPEEARNAIRIIELALESSKEKRTIPFSE